MSEEIIKRNIERLDEIIDTPEALHFIPARYPFDFVVPFAHVFDDDKLFLSYNSITGMVMPPVFDARRWEYSKIMLKIKEDKTLIAARKDLILRLKPIDEKHFGKLLFDDLAGQLIKYSPGRKGTPEKMPGDMALLHSIREYNTKRRTTMDNPGYTLFQ